MFSFRLYTYFNFCIKQPNYLQPTGSGSVAHRGAISLKLKDNSQLKWLAAFDVILVTEVDMDQVEKNPL